MFTGGRLVYSGKQSGGKQGNRGNKGNNGNNNNNNNNGNNKTNALIEDHYKKLISDNISKEAAITEAKRIADSKEALLKQYDTTIENAQYNIDVSNARLATITEDKNSTEAEARYKTLLLEQNASRAAAKEEQIRAAEESMRDAAIRRTERDEALVLGVPFKIIKPLAMLLTIVCVIVVFVVIAGMVVTRYPYMFSFSNSKVIFTQVLDAKVLPVKYLTPSSRSVNVTRATETMSCSLWFNEMEEHVEIDGLPQSKTLLLGGNVADPTSRVTRDTLISRVNYSVRVHRGLITVDIYNSKGEALSVNSSRYVKSITKKSTWHNVVFIVTSKDLSLVVDSALVDVQPIPAKFGFLTTANVLQVGGIIPSAIIKEVEIAPVGELPIEPKPIKVAEKQPVELLELDKVPKTFIRDVSITNFPITASLIEDIYNKGSLASMKGVSIGPIPTI